MRRNWLSWREPRVQDSRSLLSRSYLRQCESSVGISLIPASHFLQGSCIFSVLYTLDQRVFPLFGKKVLFFQLFSKIQNSLFYWRLRSKIRLNANVRKYWKSGVKFYYICSERTRKNKILSANDSNVLDTCVWSKTFWQMRGTETFIHRKVTFTVLWNVTKFSLSLSFVLHSCPENRLGEQASVTAFSGLSINRRSSIAETRPRVVNQRTEATLSLHERSRDHRWISRSPRPPLPPLFGAGYLDIPRSTMIAREHAIYIRDFTASVRPHDNASSH